MRPIRKACQLDPEPSDFHLNLGVTHQYLQQLDKAISAYKTAWQKNNQPAYRFNLAQALLLAGRYEEGWAEYEWRRRIPEYQPRYEWHPPERQWKGQPFPGQTLLVYHEQGLGDDIQFSRYIPQVKALGGKSHPQHPSFSVPHPFHRLWPGPDRRTFRRGTYKHQPHLGGPHP